MAGYETLCVYDGHWTGYLSSQMSARKAGQTRTRTHLDSPHLFFVVAVYVRSNIIHMDNNKFTEVKLLLRFAWHCSNGEGGPLFVHKGIPGRTTQARTHSLMHR